MCVLVLCILHEVRIKRVELHCKWRLVVPSVTVVFLFVFYDSLTLVNVAYYYGLYTFLFVILQFFVFLLVTRFCFLKAYSLGTVIYAIFYYFSFNASR